MGQGNCRARANLRSKPERRTSKPFRSDGEESTFEALKVVARKHHGRRKRFRLSDGCFASAREIPTQCGNAAIEVKLFPHRNRCPDPAGVVVLSHPLLDQVLKSRDPSALELGNGFFSPALKAEFYAFHSALKKIQAQNC